MDLGEYSFEEVELLADKIEGWLESHEAKLLYNTALNLKHGGAIVEIGSWHSKSLTFLSAGSLKAKNNCKKFSIDPFLNSKDEPNGAYEKFIENLKQNGLYDKVTHIKEKSQIAGLTFDEEIELLFIDGFHKYDAVKRDFDLFYPKIINEGYVIFHDVACYEGPTTLVKELAENNSTFKIITFADTLLIAQKVLKLSDADKLNNEKTVQTIENILNILVDRNVSMIN